MRELLARIKKALNEEKENGDILNIGEAVIDVSAGKVFINKQLIPLTALEYRLLLIFAQNKSVLLKREQILERIWDISGNIQLNVLFLLPEHFFAPARNELMYKYRFLKY